MKRDQVKRLAATEYLLGSIAGLGGRNMMRRNKVWPQAYIPLES